MVTTLADGGFGSPFNAESASSVCIRARRLPLVPTTISIAEVSYHKWSGLNSIADSEPRLIQAQESLPFSLNILWAVSM